MSDVCNLSISVCFKYLGGQYRELSDGIYQIDVIPEVIVKRLKEKYNIYAENLTQLYFFFDF
jgi:hypothetical protein